MSFFEEATKRLKDQLKLRDDKEVADAFGISTTAWAMRKKRDSFPTKEVFALAAQRPELELDPDWIVTGVSTKVQTAGNREASLLECFRKLTDREQKKLLEIALLWAGVMQLTSRPDEDEIKLDLTSFGKAT